MNKILIENNEIKLNIDNKIKIEKEENEIIHKYKIIILKNTSLLINYQNLESKINIIFEVLDKVNFKLYEIKKGKISKIQEQYILNNNSVIKVDKINDIESIKENIIVDLNGINSKIDYNFKTITKDKESYVLTINHNNIKTSSLIKNNGINILDGELNIEVSTFIKKGMIESNCEQINRIINETNNKCVIKPNLFIDENNVNANHSASIGKFNESELFYLQSRGLDYNEAKKLLIKGFILSDIDKCILKETEKIIKNYWR